MMMRSSFVDLLFILLCSAIVLLSQSLHIGAVEIAPAEAGGGGISEVNADDVRVVAVYEERLVLEEGDVASPAALAEMVSAEETVLLVSGDERVSHHRMMDVWSALRERRVAVRFGVIDRTQRELASQDGGDALAHTGAAGRTVP